MIKFRELNTLTDGEINFILINIFRLSEAKDIGREEDRIIAIADNRKGRELRCTIKKLNKTIHISFRCVVLGHLHLPDKEELELFDKYMLSLGMNSLLKDNPYLGMEEETQISIEVLAAEHVETFKEGNYPLEVYLGGLTVEVGTEMLNQLGMTWRIKMSNGTYMTNYNHIYPPMIELSLFDGFITKANSVKGDKKENDNL